MDSPALGRTNEIDVPSLILSGENDLLTCREIGTMLDGPIADLRLLVVPGSGHMMLMEKPDAFNTLLLDFLEADATGR